MGNDFKNMKAMIMAAGVGSRLDPLTKSVPKPLVPVANRPVMDILLENLADIGVSDVIANTHYLADEIVNRYSDNNFGINFNYIREENLSGTAGGLKKCQHFFDEGDDFIVLSADGLTNADIKKGIKIHKNSGAIATIGIKQIPKEDVSHFGVVVTDEDGFISEFQEKPPTQLAKSNFINTGIYIFNYKIFNYIPHDTFYDFAKNVFPKLLNEHAINTFVIDNYWTDIGTLEQYVQSTHDLFNGFCEFRHEKIIKTNEGAYIKGDSNLPSDINIVGNCTIGNGCRFGKNVVIENSIIWNNVVVKDNVKIKNSVIASDNIISSNLYSQIIGSNQFNIDTANLSSSISI